MPLPFYVADGTSMAGPRAGHPNCIDFCILHLRQMSAWRTSHTIVSGRGHHTSMGVGAL